MDVHEHNSKHVRMVSFLTATFLTSHCQCRQMSPGVNTLNSTFCSKGGMIIKVDLQTCFIITIFYHLQIVLHLQISIVYNEVEKEDSTTIITVSIP